jgi:hypothetical protein
MMPAMRPILAALALAAATACATSGKPPTPAAPGSAALANLRFLEGTWRGQQGAFWIEEVWTAPAGNSLMGVARTLRGANPVDLELALLHQSEDMLVLHLRHFGAAADRLEERGPKIPYRLVRHAEDEAVFEAMGPDDVRRIVYRRDGDALEVTLEREEGEPLQWRYERVR